MIEKELIDHFFKKPVYFMMWYCGYLHLHYVCLEEVHIVIKFKNIMEFALCLVLLVEHLNKNRKNIVYNHDDTTTTMLEP